MIWRERLPAGLGAACSPALGVAVSARGLPGLILLSPCHWCQHGAPRISRSARPHPGPAVVLPAHAPVHLVCPSPSWAPGLLLEPLIHSGGAGEGWPRIGCELLLLPASKPAMLDVVMEMTHHRIP